MTVYDCAVLNLPKVQTEGGNITALNNGQELPFAVQRVYYLYDIPGGESRGGHAHYQLEQLIVAASGSFDVLIKDGNQQRTITLNQPYMGLHLVPGIWRELLNFSSGAICLVLASEPYEEEDYIRDYETFLACKG